MSKVSKGLHVDRPGLTQEEVAELKEAFNLFDTDGSGTIDPSELRSAMTSLGYDVKNPLVFQILSNLDKSDKRNIDFEEFLDMMTARMSDKDSKEDINKVFALFDDNSTGFITLDHLKRVARELGEEMSEEELREMIERADLDGDGAISQDEFFNIMTKKTFQ